MRILSCDAIRALSYVLPGCSTVLDSMLASDSIVRHAESVARQSERIIVAAESAADECAQLGFIRAAVRVDSIAEAANVQAGHRHVLH